jgi:sigma-E factor negative regulatory protein RseC
MIREQASVLRCETGRVWVAPKSVADCERCARGQGCGGGVLGRLVGDRLHEVEVDPNGHELAVGDRVVLGLSEPVLLKASLAAYMLPLACLFAGALLGRTLAPGEGDGAELLGAAGGLALGIMLARKLAGPARRASAWQPKVVARLEADETPEGLSCG